MEADKALQYPQGGKKNSKANGSVKQRGTDGYQRQHSQGVYNPLDIVGVLQEDACTAGQALGKKAMDDQARKEIQCKTALAG